MRIRILLEPNWGATYLDVLEFTLAAEALGFDAVFCSDHFLAPSDRTGLPGPCDAWTTVAGLARETSTIRLGTLMSPVTFRLPGPLAIAVAQVDQMSGGRIELGLGTGWNEAEHRAYGIPFPDTPERFRMLEEQLAVVTGLWAESPEPFSFDGRHYRLEASPGLPKPLQRPRPPILIGGVGAKTTPRLAATFADEFNVPVRSLEVTRLQFERVSEACDRAGREASSIVFSAVQVLCIGESRAELEVRAQWMGRTVDVVRADGLAGSVDDALEKIAEFAAAGAQGMYLQILDLKDLDHLRLAGERLLHAATEI